MQWVVFDGNAEQPVMSGVSSGLCARGNFVCNFINDIDTVILTKLKSADLLI